jgi:hypothetical protein
MADRYFFRNAQTVSGTGGTTYDLSTTQGTGTTLVSAGISSTSFTKVFEWRRVVASGQLESSFPVSVNISAVSASTLQVRWRVSRLNSSGTLQASSGYSAAYNSTGTKTDTLTLDTTWAADDFCVVEMELRRNGGANSARTVTISVNNASTYVDTQDIHVLTATGVSSGTPTVGTPALTQSHTLVATGVATDTPTVGSPELTSAPAETPGYAWEPGSWVEGSWAEGSWGEETEPTALTADSVSAGTPTVGQPALTQSHTLTATGVDAGTPTVGSPALGQEHTLAATGVASGTPTVGQPALTQSHTLVATGIDAGTPTVGSPAVGQDHTLTADDVSSGTPTVGSPVLTSNAGQTLYGWAEGCWAAGSWEEDAWGESIPPVALEADDLSSGAPTVGTPALTQAHVLSTQGNSRYLRPDGESYYLRPDGVSYYYTPSPDLSTGRPTVGTPELTSQGPL